QRAKIVPESAISQQPGGLRAKGASPPHARLPFSMAGGYALAVEAAGPGAAGPRDDATRSPRGAGATTRAPAGAPARAPSPSSPPPPPPQDPPPSPLLALDGLPLSRLLAFLPDPSAAALTCKAMARITCGGDEDFALSWLCGSGGGAGRGPPGCAGTRAVAWRGARRKDVPGLVRWLAAARRRQRAEERGGAVRAAPAAAGLARGAPLSAAAAAALDARRCAEEEEAAAEEEDALLLLEEGRPCVALVLLAGPYSQHLLLPLAARCGDLPLVRALLESADVPLRPMLLEGDAATTHYAPATTARAAMRGGRRDVDRTDPACAADPFGFLRFCCRHSTAAVLTGVPPLRRAALAAVARGAPAVLLRQLAAAAAGRGDAEGAAVARGLARGERGVRGRGARRECAGPGRGPGRCYDCALAKCWVPCWIPLEAHTHSPHAPSHALPKHAHADTRTRARRGGNTAMQGLMVRLAERHGLMSCLPGQMAQSTAAVREVLAAAVACAPPVGDEPLVQFLRAALQSVLGQPLVDAGHGDSAETAEALWAAARARGLQAQVTARLQLPPSVPARVWLERRRLEGLAAAAGGGAARGGGGGGGGALQRWIAGLRGGGGGGGCGDAPPDPPLSHLLECLEGAHGASALDAAKRMLASARPGGDGGGDDGGAAGGGGSWLVLREQGLLPGGDAVAEAAAVGAAIVAAAEGNAAALEALRRGPRRKGGGRAHDGGGAPRSGGDRGDAAPPRDAWARELWEPHRWSSDGESDGSGGGGGGCGGAFPEPGDLGYDKMLIAAAKHGHAPVLRALLPPLVAARRRDELAGRGALLMGVALQLRQRGLVRALEEHGLAGRAADGYRLLQTRPRRRPPGPPAVVPPLQAAPARGAAGRALGAAAAAAAVAEPSPGGAWSEEDEAEAAEDAELALSLLRAATPGGRDERLLNSWLTAAATQPEGGARLCGRRAAAVLRGAARAPRLPVGARVAAPRSLLTVAVLPTADLDVLEAAFEWLERAELVVE
ncbi:MAG: hypothetical protein J3K34DRAFT_496255, partial [Monoraphidium minutum]